MITWDRVKAPDWVGSLVTQINAAFLAIRPDNAVKISGGSIDGTTVGATTPSTGAFTTLSATQQASLATTNVAGLTSTQLITTVGGATFLKTSTALSDGAAGNLGTLATAPSAGNPTKWIGINDNGTVRYIPAW